MSNKNQNELDFNESLELIKKNKIEDAEEILERLKNKRVFEVEVFTYLAVCKIKKEQKIKATELLNKALEISPDHEFANLNLGLILFEKKNYKEAISFFLKSFDKNNLNIITLYHLGLANMLLNNLEKAENYFNKIINLNKNDENTLLNLGILYRKKNELKKSLEIYERIIKINPNNLNALNNIGVLNYNLLNYDNAIKNFNKCIAINNNFLPPYNNIGRVYTDLKKFEQAKQSFEKSISLNKQDFVARFELSKIYLSLKEYERGFEYYEYRKYLDVDHRINFIKNKFKSKEWNGEELVQKKILILSEQGFGDIILFRRYLDVLFKNNEVIFLTNKRLNYIFQNSNFKIINDIEEIPEHDYYQYLLSLPGIYYKKYKSFCKNVNYIKGDYDNDKKWSSKLDNQKKIKIGLSWQGNKKFTGDLKRSIPLKKLEKIIMNNKFQIISLQKDFGLEQIKNNNYEKYINDYSHLLDIGEDAFKDTISILKNLDLLITIESSIAQLAGTLGIKTILLLSFNPYWIWYTEKEKKTFYESIDIYQQKIPGEWDSVIDDVLIKLNKL